MTHNPYKLKVGHISQSVFVEKALTPLGVWFEKDSDRFKADWRKRMIGYIQRNPGEVVARCRELGIRIKVHRAWF